MSSPSMYTLVDRVDDGGKPNKRRESATRFQIPEGFNSSSTSIRQALPSVHSDEPSIDAEYSLINIDYKTEANSEKIVFVYLDLHSQLIHNMVSLLRAINNDVRTYTDSSTCLDLLRSSNDRIFFISSSDDKDLIEEVHNINAVENMFILNSDTKIDKNKFPKLYGVFTHFEELLMALRNTLEWFEETQGGLFVFERDRIFLWSQLWKEEFIRSTNQTGPSNKKKLVDMAENYYRGNTKLIEAVNEFNQYYNKSDALQWCFSSPFPSRLLRQALRSHNAEQLDFCRFLLIHVSHVLQQMSKSKSSGQFYRGMKLTNELLNKLEKHTDKLICPKGFLTCMKSRKNALETANSPDHRPDLMPVLFKINYDSSVPTAELSMKDGTKLIVFDVFTVFRVKYVNRGPVSVVKIEPADEDGRSLAREYLERHDSENMQKQLDQLLAPLKPPARLPPIEQPLLPQSESVDLSPNDVGLSVVSDDESHAQELVKRGEIDQALAIYQHLENNSARILNIIGSLYAEKKGDYDCAIKYYKKALKIQEKNGEDVSDTLTQLGIVYLNRRDYDLALSYHTRALDIRKKSRHTDHASIVNSLIGIANAQCGKQNLSEALKHAEQALDLNESIGPENDLNIATNLAILANIYHSSGDNMQALDVATRAFGIFERCLPPDSFPLSTLLNNLGAIQMAVGSFSDSRASFVRALEICEKNLPEGHPKRVTMENNIRRIAEMEEKYMDNSTTQL